MTSPTKEESKEQYKLMNKIEPLAWNMEHTNTEQRGGERGIMVERRGRDWSKNMYE